jgi:hypothetical protein
MMLTTFIPRTPHQHRRSAACGKNPPLNAIKYMIPSKNIIRANWPKLGGYEYRKEHKADLSSRRTAGVGELPQINGGRGHSHNVEHADT